MNSLILIPLVILLAFVISKLFYKLVVYILAIANHEYIDTVKRLAKRDKTWANVLKVIEKNYGDKNAKV